MVTWQPLAEPCHCGRPAVWHMYNKAPFTRFLCEGCDSVRCDAYPDECPYDEPRSESQKVSDRAGWMASGE